MIVERGNQGAWCICEVVNGYLFKRMYFGYTKRDAIKAFNKAKKEQA